MGSCTAGEVEEFVELSCCPEDEEPPELLCEPEPPLLEPDDEPPVLDPVELFVVPVLVVLVAVVEPVPLVIITGLFTVKVVVLEAVPPAPLQVRVYVWIPTEFNIPDDTVPLVALVPVHAPVAVQAVAFTVLQVRVADPPFVIVGIEVVRVTLGAGVVTTTFFSTTFIVKV